MHADQSTASPEQLLQRAPLFARLSRKSLQKLASLCVPRSYQAGAMIIEEASTGLGMFLVTSGRLEVFKGQGDTRIFLAEMGPGDILGEMALIDDQPRSASAVALDPTECLLITRGSFQTLVRKDPEIAWCIVPTLAERVRELQRKIIEGGIDLTRRAEPSEPSAATPPAETTPVEPDRSEQPDGRQERAQGSNDEGRNEGRDEIQDKDKDDSDVAMARPILWAMREQYALTMAGFTGLQGSLRCLERFLSSLASETELSSGDSLGAILRDIPKGLLSAAEAALEEGERVPERMLSRYRRDRVRSAESADTRTESKRS